MLKTKIQLWGVGTARTMRVHWMLHELDLSYQTFPIKARSGETQTDSYLDINPKGKIPTLVHNKFVLSEGFAILRYLSNLSSSEDKDYFQSSLEGQATYDEWASFILMELDATALYVIRRHKDLEEIYGHSAEAVSSAEKYFEKMLVWTSFKSPSREQSIVLGATFLFIIGLFLDPTPLLIMTHKMALTLVL